VGSNLGGVEGGDLVGNDIGGLDVEVNIVDAQLLVEPLNLLVNQGLGEPAALLDDGLDGLDLLRLALELRGDVADCGRAQNAVSIPQAVRNLGDTDVGGLR
jgi:hypothetical protein